MGQHSHFEFGWEGKPGETVEKVLHDSPRPVIVVPDPLPLGESIAIAYDGSLQAARALTSFTATGLSRGRTVHVITAAAVDDRPHAARRAEGAIVFLKNHEIDATSHIVESTREPAKVLLKKAQDLGDGLLVMGSYGHTLLREFFLGSVTRTVLKESPIPVFCNH
jgi:nucleotide-binding universal stress UspA family protein